MSITKQELLESIAATDKLIEDYNRQENVRAKTLLSLGWQSICYHEQASIENEAITLLFAPHVDITSFPFVDMERGNTLFDFNIRYAMRLKAKSTNTPMNVDEAIKPFPSGFFSEDEFTVIDLY